MGARLRVPDAAQRETKWSHKRVYARLRRAMATLIRDRHGLGDPNSVSVFIGGAKNSVHSRGSGNPRLRVPGERSETRDPDTRSAALGPRFRGDERRES